MPFASGLLMLAHAGEHSEASEQTSLISSLFHQSTPISLLIVAACLGAVYLVTAKIIKLSFSQRLLAVVATAIVLGMVYLSHNPTVTAIVLSVGFIACFLLTFALLKQKPGRAYNTVDDPKTKKP